MRMSEDSKTSFSLPQTECPDTEGLVPALVTVGRTGDAVDHGQLGCGGSELGQGATLSTSQNQILGAVAWLSLLHRVSGTFLGSPELRCILGWVTLWKDTKTSFGPGHGLVGAGAAPPRVCLGPASQKAVPATSRGGNGHLLEQLFGVSARRAAEDGNS